MKFVKPVINQRLRLLAVALTLGTLILDLAVLQLQYMNPETVQASTEFQANPGANGAMLVQLAKQEREGKPCDVIFIGASNVEFWNTEGRAVWDKYYAPRHAFNFGVSGDRTENVLWRFDHINLQALKPKVGVIFIGLNNVDSTPREVALGVRAIMEKTQAIFPGIKIILVSLTPNGRDDATVVQANEIMKTYADDASVFYLDLYSQLPREGSNT